MATYGHTFTSGDTLTPTKLNAARTATDIVNADIAAAAAIAATKLASDSITNTQIKSDAAIAYSKLALTNSIVAGDLTSASVTAAKLDGAQTGSAPIYGCRAWVNFDGTTADNIGGTYSRALTTVTVTTTAAHNLKAGHIVFLDFTSGAAVDGTFTVASVPSTTQFTVTHGTSGSTSGNATLNRRLIRASGNVANVSFLGTGSYAANFTEAMSDANYAALATVMTFSAGSVVGAVSAGGLTAISAQLVAYSPTFNTINAPAFHLAVFR